MNRTIRTIVATLGIIFAVGGISHGFFEVLQGYTPTNGLIIDAIGPQHIAWKYGGETAFTIIPNFLITGIAAISVSLIILVWSAGFLHTKHGATVFLSLFILLFLVGGGIGQIVFFTMGWAFALHIKKPLTWWRKILPEGLRNILADTWQWLLVAGSIPILIALEIAVFGYLPGVQDADQLITIVLLMLGMSIAIFLLTFVAGVANDIRQQDDLVSPGHMH